MGLDQYLSKRTYVKFREHKEPDGNYKVTVQPPKGRAEVKPERIQYIEEELCYWRKANMIHQWFENNVADGDFDNGQDLSVSLSDLERLLDDVNKVLAASKLIDGKIANGYSFDKKGNKVCQYEDGKIIEDSTVAEELLPTTSGFFFGSTDYDEYYIQDLEETRDMLTAVIEEGDENGDYYYSANW